MMKFNYENKLQIFGKEIGSWMQNCKGIFEIAMNFFVYMHILNTLYRLYYYHPQSSMIIEKIVSLNLNFFYLQFSGINFSTFQHLYNLDSEVCSKKCIDLITLFFLNFISVECNQLFG